MTGRVQTLRSNVAGNRPTGRQPGELYVNWPDKQFGVVDSTATAVDLIAVRFFSATTSYNVGDYVVQSGKLYQAKVAVSPGAFNATQWGLTGGNVQVSDTAPATPDVGTLWWDSVGGQLYVWYNDGTSSQWVIAVNAGKTDLSGLVPLAGGTMTGPLILAADPTAALGAVTKQYVDSGVNSARWGDNRIINGDMRIDQRNGGNSGTSNGYMLDRWAYGANQAGKIQWNRANSIAMELYGFPYVLQGTSLSAYTALATDNFEFWQAIEADFISDFSWGTANAQPVTLSFWAMSSKTGTFSGSVSNYAGTRSYPFTFALTTVTGWQKFAITIPGDTTGTWVMQGGNAGAMYVQFDLGAGANWRGPANAWASANYVGVTGAQSIVNTNAAYMQITGVKLEIGSIATPFNRKTLQETMADCQRYYQTLSGTPTVTQGYNAGGAAVYNSFIFPVQMRAAPSVSFSSQGYTNSSALGLQQTDNTTLLTNLTITATGYGYGRANIALNAEL